MTIIWICALFTTGVLIWSVVGFVTVIYLDMFGARYDYDKDYELTTWQRFKAGPLVWVLEYRKRK